MSPGSEKQASLRKSAVPTDEQRVHSADLLRGTRRLVIEHRGEAYCLRLTRNERLILTKL